MTSHRAHDEREYRAALASEIRATPGRVAELHQAHDFQGAAPDRQALRRLVGWLLGVGGPPEHDTA